MPANDDRRAQLAVPAEVLRLGARVRLRWQVGLGQLLEPTQPIARLDGDAGKGSLLLEVPSDCRGMVEELWIEDGAEVMVGEPLVTLAPRAAADHPSEGLAEAAVAFDHRDSGMWGLSQSAAANQAPLDAAYAVPARRLRRMDRIILAAVGGFGLAGLVFAAIGVLSCLVLRDGAPALLAAGSLAVVAVGLSSGKACLDRIGA
jgi:hypothetical protein